MPVSDHWVDAVFYGLRAALGQILDVKCLSRQPLKLKDVLAEAARLDFRLVERLRVAVLGRLALLLLLLCL